MCFKTPKPPPVQTPTPAADAPKLNDEAVTAVRDDASRRGRAAAGLSSTIKTDPTGLSALYGEQKKLLGQ